MQTCGQFQGDAAAMTAALPPLRLLARFFVSMGAAAAMSAAAATLSPQHWAGMLTGLGAAAAEILALQCYPCFQLSCIPPA